MNQNLQSSDLKQKKSNKLIDIKLQFAIELSF